MLLLKQLVLTLCFLNCRHSVIYLVASVVISVLAANSNTKSRNNPQRGYSDAPFKLNILICYLNLNLIKLNQLYRHK